MPGGEGGSEENPRVLGAGKREQGLGKSASRQGVPVREPEPQPLGGEGTWKATAAV